MKNHTGHLVLTAHVGALGYQEHVCLLLEPLFRCHGLVVFHLSQLRCLNIMAGALAVAGVATVALAALAKLLDEARELLSLLERSLLCGLGISIR